MQQVEGQIEGCLAQALGYALLEDLQTRDGNILTPHLSTYLLPTALDMPAEIVPVVLELADPHGPFGARGVAEMPLVPFLPAVAAAIHDATGVWLTEQPMTPERVLASLCGCAQTLSSAKKSVSLEGSARLSQLLRITAGPFEFVARVEEALAPKTCAAFLRALAVPEPE